ncbi:hypothetical protein B1813_01990 [Saccharomonospora piscinae]|uniref:DUF1795 domain-containing protein n=1 Tax=Saccharomonospora piscinae TaxID=687388 RepID=A0A1V9ACL0_SACPI|nr:hypothetical protein [Saccharomonospora piscinae]OQO94867.1 hypothetical protein B1813_01990 [Saccharomonospora piscinae]TLW94415.1 hypothetical protein FFT09_00430 [Saccharomonospora piscinae]
MATTIPVPIQFSLPDGWRSVDPDELGTPEAAFVALRPGSRGEGFTPNITISGDLRPSDVPLSTIAEESVERLRRGSTEVSLGRTTEGGTTENPVRTQAVRVEVELAGQRRYLVQYQVFMAFANAADPRTRPVLRVVLTSTMEQFPEVVDDFQAFLDTITPEQGTPEPGERR